MNNSNQLPAALVNKYIHVVDQGHQDCAALQLLVCRICGAVVEHVHVGVLQKGLRCVVSAAYSDESAKCRQCWDYSSPGYEYEAKPGEVQYATYSWARDVIAFQASVADARVDVLEERLTELERMLGDKFPHMSYTST